MSKHFTLCFTLAMVSALAFAASPSPAVVAVPITVKKLHDGSTHVAAAKVDLVDPARPALKLTITDDLKGALAEREILVNLTGNLNGDPPSRPTDVTERIAAGMTAIVFVAEDKDKPANTTAMIYCEGSWLRIARNPDGGKAWPYLFGEFYFRQAFSGTTAQLKQALDDIKAGGKGPDVNASEKAGLGSPLPGVTPTPLTIPPDPAAKPKDKSAPPAADKDKTKDAGAKDSTSKTSAKVVAKDGKPAAAPKPAAKSDDGGLFKIVGVIVMVAGVALLVYVFVIRKKK